MESPRPLIIDVARGGLEDGPGIRSVVFFKGCPLDCIFCQNPEAKEPGPELAFFIDKCIQCGECAKVCPESAIEFNHPGRIVRDKCTRCGNCAIVCPGDGLKLIGKYYSIEELIEILMRDKGFYLDSGGGVTLSGGECTMFPDYLESLLQILKKTDIHITLETSGFFHYSTFQRKILPYLDLIYYDLKLADPKQHRKFTGQSNKPILDNFHRLLMETGKEVKPRIPLVPGVTATEKNLKAMFDLLIQTGVEDVALLPYNPMWMNMVESLGKTKPNLPRTYMTPEEEREIFALFKALINHRPQKNDFTRASSDTARKTSPARSTG